MGNNNSNPEDNFQVDFLGIGAMKSATTWIYECLKEHPEICGSSEKEIHFFDRPWNYKKGLEWYRSFFEHCPEDKLKGEFTSTYYFWVRKGMRETNIHRRIHNYFPEVKLIACLRNPIERAYSHYRMAAFAPSFYGSFKEAIDEMPRLVELGFYYQHLKKYFDLFPRENIKVLIYEDIKEDPTAFIQELYKFLEVNPEFVPPSADERKGTSSKKTVQWRSPLLGKLLYRMANNIRFNSIYFRILRKTGIRSLYKKIARTNRKTVEEEGVKPSRVETLPSETRTKLYQTYKEDIRNLENLTNKDLSHWKEDERN